MRRPGSTAEWGRPCGRRPPRGDPLDAAATKSQVAEVEGPGINRDEGTTFAFSKAQPSKLLKVPAEDTITSLRDRAGRSVCRSGRVQGHHLKNQRLMQSLTSAVNRS